MRETGQGSVNDTMESQAVPPAGRQSQLWHLCGWGDLPAAGAILRLELGGQGPVLSPQAAVTDLH